MDMDMDIEKINDFIKKDLQSRLDNINTNLERTKKLEGTNCYMYGFYEGQKIALGYTEETLKDLGVL